MQKPKQRSKSRLETQKNITVLKSSTKGPSEPTSNSVGPRTSITIKHQKGINSNPKASFDSGEEDQVQLVSKRPFNQGSKRKLNLIHRLSSDPKRSAAARSPKGSSPRDNLKISKQISV